MSRSRDARTYRIRQLPSFINLSEVPKFLMAACDHFAATEDIRVFSLAHSLSQYESLITKTATVVFTRTPEIFDNDNQQWTVECEHADWKRNLLFDIHFLGLTPLNDRAINEAPFDCIAISGLASHPFGSWKQRGKSNFMWLRDQLPHDKLNCCSIIYGYDTRLAGSQSFQTIDDLALSFASKLRLINRDETSIPLVLFAHSLGGIVLKRAMALMANSNQGDDPVLRNIRIVFLFGVPNQGMKMSHLLAMVEGQPNERLVQSLSAESEYLSTLDIQFSGLSVFRTISLVSAYETKLSRTTEETKPGTWERVGPCEVLVDRVSAIQRGTPTSDIFPINEDHSNIVKFSRDDTGYQDVISRLKKLKTEFDNFAAPRSVVSSSTESVKVSNDALRNEKEQIELKELLRSLQLDETESRREQIEKQHSGTLGWIFQKEKLGFTQWLKNGAGLYWIRGKPGSGKSTLMKFLSCSKEVGEHLESARPGIPTIIGWYFFYSRGSYIQKSLEGLRRSILYQIVKSDERLAKLILPIYTRREKTKRSLWLLEDLKNALEMIFCQRTFPLRLCLFLDALDECDDQPMLTATFLKSLADGSSESMTAVDVCFTSRPWPIFIELFDQSLGFNIHDQTTQDIWKYTEVRLMEYKSIRELFVSKHGASELVSAIVKEAQGVFLWVRLVIDDLLTSHADGSSLHELMAVVNTVHGELGDFYSSIIDRIPQKYRLESYIMMETLVCSETQLTLADFARTVDCALCQTVQESLQRKRTGPLSIASPNEARRRLQSRCGGLIELIDYTDGGENPYRVQFMHQTVKDYVSNPGLEQLVLGHRWNPVHQNGHSFLAKSYLTMLQSNSVNASMSIFMAAMAHSRLSESSIGMSQRTFLDSMSDWAVTRSLGYLTINSVISFAVVADLRLYVEEKASFVNQNREMSLLHLLAKNAAWGPSFHMEATRLYATTVSVERNLGPMCGLLLSLGANKDAVLSPKMPITPFQSLFEKWSKKLALYPNREILDVIRSFLENGQNPDVTIATKDFIAKYQYKPLHLANSQLTLVLLHHGADVNALTNSGKTALDLLAYKIRKLRLVEEKLQENVETMTLLLHYNGCITKDEEDDWDDCVKALEKYYVLPKIFLSPPVLGDTVHSKLTPIEMQPPIRNSLKIPGTEDDPVRSLLKKMRARNSLL